MKRAAVFLVALLAGACDGGCGKPERTSTPVSRSPAASASAAAMRTPETIRREGNHLVGSGSLYLQQHAHNPVDWYPWGPEALARAKALDRPIFLSIGYSSCHWCHVMEDECFSKDDVATAMNEGFVAIKVDREERPDLDATWVDAVVEMTGSAGWPLTVLLTPDLQPFFGGTYVPHDKLLPLLARARSEFATSRAELVAHGAEVRARIAKEPASGGGEKLRGSEVVALVRRMTETADAKGGFRGAPKFPNAVRWRLVLHAWRKSPDPVVEAALRAALDAMAKGGLRDQVGGGFHRYTVDGAWTVPHFEKMLYVNAELADLFLEAGAALGEPFYTEVGKDTLDFLVRDMQVKDGGFAASFDADSGGHEGTYYVWSPADLAAVVGEADAKLLVPVLGMTETGNFEGKNVLTLRGDPHAAAAARGAWERARPKLLATRAARVAPRKDEKVITAWNGLAIGALARGFARTHDVRYRTAAVLAADRIWSVHRPNGELARASNGAAVALPGMLDDYADLARGLLALFEATGDTTQLVRATTLADEVDARLKRSTGAWQLTAGAEGRLDVTDSEEPAGLGVMLEALLRLATFTSRTDHQERFDAALSAVSELARRAGPSAAATLDAALLAEGPFYEVLLVGAAAEPKVQSLQAVVDTLDPSWASRFAGPEGATGLLPGLLGKTGGRAYVCVRGACKLPTSDPASLRTQLLEGWGR
jgi:uncharacterized protein